MATGFVVVPEKKGTLYFTSSGAMKTGWLLWNKDWYYLDSQGVMQTGFLDVNGTQYYLFSSGAMATSPVSVYPATYYPDSSGAIYRTEIQNISYLMQTDSRWSKVMLNDLTMGQSGCSPNVLTMIINTLLQTNQSPLVAAGQLVEAGYLNGRVPGTISTGVRYIAGLYGLQIESITSR